MRTDHTSRRRFLRGAPLAAAAALMAVPQAASAAPEPINVEYHPRYGKFWPCPAGRQPVVPWPVDSPDFPDTRGLMSADRTEVSLPDPGIYLVTWKICFMFGPGSDRQTSLQCWTTADPDWHAGGDGQEVYPVKGQGIDGYGPNETELGGLAWVRSDGKTRIRVLAQHDSSKPLKTSDRSYEQSLNVAKWPGA